MGVKGLFQFLKRYQKDVHIPQYISQKSVGVDIFGYLHKSKGDFFTLQGYLLPIIKHAKKVYFIFDGTPSLEKRQELQKQAQKRNEINRSIQQIENFLRYPFNNLASVDKRFINTYLNQLRRQVWQPSPEYIEQTKSWLSSKGCTVYQSKNEADETLIELELAGLIDIIITNDSDLLVLGSHIVLRPVSPLRGFVFDKVYISQILDFTEQQWNDFMYLCKNMKTSDVILAHSLISVYKDLDIILQKYSTLYKEDLIKTYFINSESIVETECQEDQPK